ncbi:hypothetical protein [Nitrospirillum sp. BR 11828]|uniref:hypothetical protein n=1 Tax=Nitrospirillum sp. BR 11828 TaxID=3104325 RepID=UPI002ACA5ABB|nr:hypothetical protein [Nitrospirillum sp. BR 11828]MDZ5646007.1 hypothetical protein [Nitrospirillum sp. BR 11828]
MTNDQRRYIAIETAIGVIISAALSILFVFIVFGGQKVVPLAGHVGVVFELPAAEFHDRADEHPDADDSNPSTDALSHVSAHQ